MKALEEIERYILYLVVFLLPLAILPIFPNYYEIIKLAVLVYGIILIFILKAVRILSSGNFSYSAGNFDIPLVLLLGVVLASAILKTPNKMEAFFLPGSASIVLSGILIYFLANQLSENTKKNLLTILIASGAIVSLISLVAYFGAFSSFPQLPEIFKDKLFNTVGSPLLTALFLGTLVPSSVYLVIKENTLARRLYIAGFLALILIGLGILVYNLTPSRGNSPVLPDFRSSWVVSVDTLKESPFLGAGPGNYLTAFNRFRPLSYNATTKWNTRFTTGSNFYLTLLTEVGLVAFAILAIIIFWLIKNYKQYLENPGFASFIALSILLALFPPFTVGIISLFILLSICTKTKRVNFNLVSQNYETPIASRLPLFVSTLPIIFGSIFLGYYFGYRLLSAESTFKKSLDALGRNDIKATYDLMIAAININPNIDRYHLSFAQVNMALARSASQKTELTEDERNTISQLIQQAINQAKVGVSLNPGRSQNWEILGSTYREIMAFAQGADKFTIDSFSQAVALDPINPNLRIALGGVYFSLGDYDNAVDAFKLATLAKPDLANAHYNLAVAYREKGEIERAINEIQIVLSLVQKESEDYKLASSELEALEKRRPKKEQESTENLTHPEKTEPVVSPPLPLDKNL